jgi:uncharacterized protein YodC (DUF2158 family)
MENDLQNGDEVQLKTGGPCMTIDSIDETTSRAACVWFDNKQVMKTEIALNTLKKCDKTPQFVGGAY